MQAVANLKPRAPMFLGAAAFAIGIVFANYCWRPPLWLAVGAVVCSTSAALLLARRQRLAYGAGLLTVALIGALAASGEAERSAQDAASSNFGRYCDGGAVTIDAYVLRAPAVVGQQAMQSDHVTLDVETETISSGATTEKLAGGIRLSIYRRRGSESEYGGDSAQADAVPPPFRYGDRLRFTGKLREPRNFGNQGALDYRSMLQQQGIAALGSTGADKVERLPGVGGSRWGRWRSCARESVLRKIHEVWPEREAGLMDAMLIGERAFLQRETSLEFQRSGTYHILVVSGMNVGILALVIFWLLRRIRFGEQAASLVTVAISSGYAYLCDGGAPIVRATLMLCIYLICRLIYRDRAALNALGTAALVVLVASPNALFEASFQLTFASVLAIAGIGVPLLERTSGPWRGALRNFESTTYDLQLPPKVAQLRLDMRLVIGRLRRLIGRHASQFVVTKSLGAALGIFDVLMISALMQFALALPMAWYFHRATLLALPANALVVPLAEILMPAAVAALAVAYISAWVAKPFAMVAAWALEMTTSAVKFFGSGGAADIRVATPEVLLIGASVVVFALALLGARRRRWIFAASLAALVGVGASLVLLAPRPDIHSGEMEVTAIDVGQADSTLIVSPEGRAILVDAAGPLGFSHSEFDFGENVVSPYLWSRGISRLDIVILTHAHSDHLGGMRSVLVNFRPRELWVGPNAQVKGFEALLSEADQLGVHVVQRTAGDEFDWSGMHFRVLAPPKEWQPEERVKNDDSLAMRISYGKTALLLEGDAEKKSEALIAAQRPAAQLWKLAHNGSATSSTPELLAVVHPRYAFVSAGYRNQFGHPRPEVLRRLAEAHVATYRTDTTGALTFLLDGSTVRPIPGLGSRN